MSYIHCIAWRLLRQNRRLRTAKRDRALQGWEYHAVQTEPTVVISFADLFRFVRRGFLWAVLTALLAGGLAYLVSQRLEPRYRAASVVVAAQANTDTSDLGVLQVSAPLLDITAYREAALSDTVLSRALSSLGQSPTPARLTSLRQALQVRTEETRTSGLLYFEVTDPSATNATRLTNALTRSLIRWDTDRARQRLDRIVSSLEQQVSALALPTGGQAQLTGRSQLRAERQEQLLYARALRDSTTGMLSPLQFATTPTKAVFPRPLLSTALALVLGGFLAYGYLFMREALNTRLRNSDDLAATSGLPVLAEFPKLPGGSRRLPRETASYLRTNLLFATADAHPKVLLVTSAQSGEGKSSVSLSLAESFARDGYKTLLIDADLRKPVLAREYGLNRSHDSLRMYLENPHAPYSPTKVAISNQESLDIIPTFDAAPSPTELLGRGFRECLESWRQEYDAIIIDSAPLLPVADTLVIAPLCSGTVFASSIEQTDRRQVRAAVALLQRVGVRVLGVVATQVPKSSKYGSGYGYGYGYGEKEPELAH